MMNRTIFGRHTLLDIFFCASKVRILSFWKLIDKVSKISCKLLSEYESTKLNISIFSPNFFYDLTGSHRKAVIMDYKVIMHTTDQKTDF